MNESDISATNLTSEARQEIRKAVIEMDSSMTRAEAERDLQKEIVKRISEKFGIDKKIVRKMAKTYHKGDFQTDQMLQEEFEASYMSVMN